MAVVKEVLADRDWAVAETPQPVSRLRQNATYAGVGDAVSGDESGQIVTSPFSGKRIRILSATDARRPRPAIEQLVSGIVMPQSLGVWVGAFGVGKTYALVDMAVCMAMGTPWLGYQTKRGGVLILDEESGERRLSDRIQMALDGHDAPNDIPLYYTSFNSFNFFRGGDECGQDLVWLIKKYEIQLVVIDALTDVAMPAKENDSEEMGIVLKTLRMIIDTAGASIHVLHHENKAGLFRGSTNIPALADLVMSVKKEQGSTRLDFAFIKARDVEAFEFSATMNFDSGRFFLSPATNPGKTPVYSRPQTHVMRYLEEHGASQISDIINDPETCTDTSARKAIYELASKGIIRRSAKGGEDNKATYELVKRD